MGFFSSQQRLLQFVIALAILLVSLLLYWGGLGGAFVLDDTPNLNIINQLPPDPQWRDFWYLANTGTAGVLGRSLSLLSFLLQYQAWPDPFQFKLVNVLLHLLNGALLATLCLALRKQVSAELQPLLTFPVIAIAVFIWLIHPLQVSTVLYVVQRMTELSTLFTLLGINLYLFGRADLRQQHNARGMVKIFAGVVLCGALATLSKESGVLLLPFIAVVELTLLAPVQYTRLISRMRFLFIYLPTLLGLLAFLAYLPTALQGYDLKPFSGSERIMTQFPVLLTYLASTALLLPNSLGLYHDDFPLVTGLLQPWYFLPAMGFVLGALVLAVLKRRQWPLFSFAVLWFLVGHALESTVLPLELYFEHRNYVPLFGPVFALVLKLRQQAELVQSDQVRIAFRGSAVLLIAWMCVLTWQQSRLWGNPEAFAVAAVAAHPESARAQSNLVETLSRVGRVEEAFAYHLESIDSQGAEISPYIRWLEFRCLLPGSAMPSLATLEMQALRARHDYGAIFLLNNLTNGIVQGRCRQTPLQELETVLENLLRNPAFEISFADLLQMQGFIAASKGEFGQAADLAAQSFVRRNDIRVGLYRTTWLLRAGLRDQAASELSLLESGYATEISASTDLTARVQFLQQELNNPQEDGL